MDTERDVVIPALNTSHGTVESTCAALCADTKEKLKMAARICADREDSRNGLKQEQKCSYLEAETDC